MARRKGTEEWVGGNGSEEPVPRNHNATERAEIIRNCCKEITDLEAERALVGAQIGEIKQKRIKGDLGMKSATSTPRFVCTNS